MFFPTFLQRSARAAAFSVAATMALPVWAGGGLEKAPDLLSPEANEIDVDEHLGEHIAKELAFKNHEGETVTLGDYFDGDRPVLLTLNYYRCPVLCNVQLNQLTESLRELDWTAGDDNFRIVTVSIDPREGVELAKKKREGHLSALERGGKVDWEFLTGDAINIRLLAAQVGVSYAYDGEQDQYAHPPVVMFVSPEGKIARYLYGLTYEPQDIKFSLMDAAEGKIGSTTEKLIFSCFHYDATLGKYGKDAMAIMRYGGVATIFVFGGFLSFFWRRERREGDPGSRELEAQA
jgi:protein SCO1/2